MLYDSCSVRCENMEIVFIVHYVKYHHSLYVWFDCYLRCNKQIRKMLKRKIFKFQVLRNRLLTLLNKYIVWLDLTVTSTTQKWRFIVTKCIHNKILSSASSFSVLKFNLFYYQTQTSHHKLGIVTRSRHILGILMNSHSSHWALGFS